MPIPTTQSEDPVERVLRPAHPLKTGPWGCSGPSDRELDLLLQTAPFEPAPVNYDEPASRHVGRSRYPAPRAWYSVSPTEARHPLNYRDVQPIG